MSKFQLPIVVPSAKNIVITQPFGVTSNTLEPVGPNGEPHFHYGVDIVLGDDHATFGAHLVCPFPKAHVINRFAVPQGDQTRTPFVQLQYNDPVTGVDYNLVLAHDSEFEPADDYTYGQMVAKIGNIGLVAPTPTLADPYRGAHLHLGLVIGSKWVDPQLYFDFANPFIGPAPTPADQAPATNWLIEEIEKFINCFAPQK